MADNKILSEADVVERIKKVLEWLEGDDIAELHNQIVAEKIKYIGDNQWVETGETDG